MNPLLFADWTHIHRVFCGLMWLTAAVLLLVIFWHTGPSSAVTHGSSIIARQSVH